jgi:sporulation protein YlmC with PRC-barrel domain
MTLAQNDLPDLPHRGHLLDARLHLLDRQLLNSDGDPVGTVDDLDFGDLEAGPTPDSAPAVTAVLSGHVLATRILGGRPPRARLQQIPWRLVQRVGVTIGLRPTTMVFDALWTEHWLREYVVSRIPGGRHAGE